MHYDIAIVGGGLVGASLACALSDTSKKILLIDAKVPSHKDARLFGLNQASCQFLNKIGVWSQISSHAVPIHQVHVSYQGHFGAVRLNRETLSLSELGFTIPAGIIENALNEMLAQQKNVTLLQPAKLTKLSQQEHVSFTVETETVEKNLTASLVIGADGAHSAVRELVNIPAEVIDYEQSALVTRTTLQKNHHHVAYERFTHNGAIAMLPLSGNECATIWTAGNDEIDALKLLTDIEFLQTLQTTFGYRLGRIQAIAKRVHYPLKRVKAEKVVEKNVFLLGNAAHTLHPIAAQGFNLALYETALLVDGLKASRTLTDISEQMEKQRNISMTVSHRLPTLFASKSSFMQCFIQGGMVAFDLMLPIKRKLMKSLILGNQSHEHFSQ